MIKKIAEKIEAILSWHPSANIHIYGDLKIQYKDWLFHWNKTAEKGKYCQDFANAYELSQLWIAPPVFTIQDITQTYLTSSYPTLKNSPLKSYFLEHRIHRLETNLRYPLMWRFIGHIDTPKLTVIAQILHDSSSSLNIEAPDCHSLLWINLSWYWKIYPRKNAKKNRIFIPDSRLNVH